MTLDSHLLAALPEIDAIYVVRILSRALHLLGAIIIGGGLFYIRSVLSPAGVGACFADRRAVWARWVGVATLLLLGSGFYNFLAVIRDAKAAGGKLPMEYHILFGVKFLLALLVMFIAAILAGKTDAADRFRGNMRKWLNIAWFAVLAIVLIGAVMRTLHGSAVAAVRPNATPAAEAGDGQEG
jgi:hypothetical protein